MVVFDDEVVFFDVLFDNTVIFLAFTRVISIFETLFSYPGKLGMFRSPFVGFAVSRQYDEAFA